MFWYTFYNEKQVMKKLVLKITANLHKPGKFTWGFRWMQR